MPTHLPAFVLICVSTVVGSGGRLASAAEPNGRIAWVPPPSQRPLGSGPTRFVDSARGDDAADGSLAKPWKTVMHGLSQIGPGETLCLRGGAYYERVRIAAVGRADAPVTIRGYPGETAIIDGGLAEFFVDPAQAWEPVAGTTDEFRSARRYRNLRYVHGSFGDTMIGLHTYYHALDLRSTDEGWHPGDPNDPMSDMAAVYCGPGLWYDPAEGRIHARLAATHLREMRNYTGSNDPRQVPLVIAASDAVSLTLDGAEHVRIQDLTIRNGGHDTVVLQQTKKIEFENCTIWAASNGVRAFGAVGLKIVGCGLHGNLPPWTFRAENSLRNREGRGRRDITRLNTHALLVPSAGREFDVYAFPQNEDWEIAYCDFTDAHDGVYFGGVSTKFHHNFVGRLHDDGLYISPMYLRYYEQPAKLEIYENHITECLTAIAFGGPELRNTDQAYVYRNLFALETVVPTMRPAKIDELPGFTPSKAMGDHGSPPWSATNIYQNTFRFLTPGRSAEQALIGAESPERPRRLLNNVIEVVDPPATIPSEIVATFRTAGKPPRFPPIAVPAAGAGVSDGNLYWIVGIEAAPGAAALAKFQSSPAFAASKAEHDGGFTSRSRVADPQLDEHGVPADGSPVVDAGAPIPSDWPDTRRDADAGKPDIGAISKGGAPLKVGRRAYQP